MNTRKAATVACLIAIFIVPACGGARESASVEAGGSPVPVSSPTIVSSSSTVLPSTVPSSADVFPSTTVSLPGDERTIAHDAVVSTWWVREANDPRVVDFYLRHEAEGDPRPYLLLGSVTAGDVALKQPIVVAEWPDVEGNVIASVQAPVVDSENNQVDVLEPGKAADFLLVVEGTVGAQLAGSEPIITVLGA